MPILTTDPDMAVYYISDTIQKGYLLLYVTPQLYFYTSAFSRLPHDTPAVQNFIGNGPPAFVCSLSSDLMTLGDSC